MRRKYIKKLSIVLLAVFVLSIMPVADLGAQTTPQIQEITLLKTHDGIDNVNNYFLYVRGANLSQISVWREKTNGGFVQLIRNYQSNTYLEFTIPSTSQGEGDVTINKIRIDTGNESALIEIGEDNMPRINTINPTKVKVQEGPLNITGENFSSIGSGVNQVTAKYFRGSTNVDITSFKDGNKIIIPNVSGALGNQNIAFERKTKFNNPSLNSNDIALNVEYRHINVFRIYEDLDISENIEIYPNRGPKGTNVYFQADKLTRNMSVFFLKVGDGSDNFKQSNKGKFVNYIPKQDEQGQDIFIVQVPSTLEVNEYDVYITNEIKDGEIPEHAITRERRLEQVFTVIDSKTQAEIISLTPAKGPDSGINNVSIEARYLTSISPNVFVPDVQTPQINIGNEDLVINYGAGTYKEFNKNQKVNATRTIKLIVGNYVSFNSEGIVVSPNGLDKLAVNIPQFNLVNTDTPTDVKALIQTKIVYTENDELKTITFHEETVKLKGFTFYPSSIEPVIDTVVPDKIMINNQNNIEEDRQIAIYGKNFMIHKYRERNNEIIRYPIVELGDLILDKNDESPIELLVLDNFNNILDGSTGSEIGTKILVTIPAGSNVSKPGKANVKITNPMRFTELDGRSVTAFDKIEFVANVEKPFITKVDPDVVTVGGGEQVTIEGSNFRPGVKVLIDGKEVTGVIRDGTGSKLSFKAPAGRAGTTQLQVLNSDGGIAVWPFMYVTTYTDPKITDFSPKEGNTGTLVVVRGQNFLQPDPTANATEIFKIIGSRILLGHQDINIYNRDNFNRISLEDYTSPNNDRVINPDTGQLSSYYHSVVLERGSNQYYVLRQEPNGTVILTNGREETYTINRVNNEIKARNQAGQLYDVAINTNKITLQRELETIELTMKTPYYVEDNEIIGNQVKVINNNEIHFWVPNLSSSGYYDLTVVNPDTKRDSRTGTQGFKYYGLPNSKPEIHSIVPAEGSTSGGYTIEINGKDFQDDGQKKSKVIINGIEVSVQNTTVSTDGTKISVIVPPYPGDLFKDKGTGRLTVPVVVLNTDGGTATKEKGFTYIVPSSQPEIIKIDPVKGSAAGGDIVEITGRDFRFFEPFEDINRNQQWDANEPYTDFNNDGKWNDFRDISGEQLRNDLGDEEFKNTVVPVLPKVYFGDKTAEILEFSNGYLKVKSPAGKAGRVDLYIVNNDSGVSPKVSYTYEASNPTITKVVPEQGSRFGKEKIEILGSGFFNSTIDVYNTSRTNSEQLTMPLVRFGQISNFAMVNNLRATVNLDGGSETHYNATDATNKKITISLKQGNETYQTVIENYDDTVKFVNVGLLTNTADINKRYDGFELIRVEINDRRLFAERGYSPKVNLERPTQLVVDTPSYYTVGKVPVTIFNPDGGKASGQFEYKNPDSRPEITNITRDTKGPVNTFIDGREIKLLNLNYQANSIVSVFGRDFREGAKIQVGSLFTIEPKDITYELPNKMTFAMPNVPESALSELFRVMVINPDGGTTSSDLLEPPILLQFTKGETSPQITKVTPVLGPASGGTVVKIEGNDFRGSMEGHQGQTPQVYFGEQRASQVQVIDHKTIQAISPLNTPGTRVIRVENPDGSMSNPGINFNYISSPKILAVVDPRDPTENTRLRNISIEGGEEIKIKGSGFMEGAKVVFSPITTKATANNTGNIIYRVGEEQVSFAGSNYTSTTIDYYLLNSGIDGTEVKFIDSETLTVKVPAGKVDTKGIIVLNPDKGASEPYEDITYGLPELGIPQGVVAEVVRDSYNNTDRFIKVNWTSVNGASQYELYVLIDNQSQYIGNTELTSYVFENLKPNTRYKFIIKAVGNFGSSKPSMESNEVRTGRNVGAPDEDGGINENTQMTRTGNTANIIIGTRDYDRNITVIDLTRGNLAGAKNVVISIPASVVSDSRARDIQIIGSDFSIRFNPTVFRIARVNENRNRNDAGVRFSIRALEGNTIIAGGNDLSTVYRLNADFYLGQSSSNIDFLTQPINLILDYDQNKAALRRLPNVAMHRFDAQNNNWQAIGWQSYLGRSINQHINRMGNYAVIGGRR